MNIGFDAKRAYHNETGLGHYSRTLIKSLAAFYPYNNYFLYNPKAGSAYQLSTKNVFEIKPKTIFNKFFSAAWRINGVKKGLIQNKIDLYHGLSHEIPFGLQSTGIKSVVTIHDLIHRRHPEQYNAIDVKIYDRKFRYACNHADRVIAISQQTKTDIINFYKIPAEKITVCYQSCDVIFSETVNEAEKKRVRAIHCLPDRYFLYVGSIIERKNLLAICKAMHLAGDDMGIPLAVIGKGGKYKAVVKAYIKQFGLEKKIIFLSEDNAAAKLNYNDFPAIYQSAVAMIYPSFFEGFGIPVLEALWSRLPVITSNVSCLPEAGGNAAYYVNPNLPQEIADGMRKIYFDKAIAADMIEKGWQHAHLFTQQKCAEAVMEVYKSLFKTASQID